MNTNSIAKEKIEEMKIVETNLQNLRIQKQSIQVEINEIDNALSELEGYEEEIYRVVSGIMLKSEKNRVVEELNKRKVQSKERIDSLEKQENLFRKKADELKKELNFSVSGKKTSE